MRNNTLALALVRAELCRAYAADAGALARFRLGDRARAAVSRIVRALTAHGRSVAIDPRPRDGRQKHLPPSEPASPPD